MDNIAVVRKVYEAFESQDLEALLRLTDPNCVVTQDPAFPWGGEFVGHEGITNLAILLLGTITSTLTIGELFEADGQVVQCGRTAGTVVAACADDGTVPTDRHRYGDGSRITGILRPMSEESTAQFGDVRAWGRCRSAVCPAPPAVDGVAVGDRRPAPPTGGRWN